MQALVDFYKDKGRATGNLLASLEAASQELQTVIVKPLPHGEYLAQNKKGGLSPTQFQTLMINNMARVGPTYGEIPLNLASAGFEGDMKSYGNISNNAYDEAGHGVPAYTHPALLNETAQVLSEVFGVTPIAFKNTLAALVLKENEQSWKNDGLEDKEKATDLVGSFLKRDEFNKPRTEEEVSQQVDLAMEYSALIPQETLTFYKERMKNLSEAIAAHGQRLWNLDSAHKGDLSLAAQLAVREAAASDPEGFIEIFNKEITDRYLGYVGKNMDTLKKGRWWGDIHVNENMGSLYNYEEGSSEDNHARDALEALVERIQEPEDLLFSLRQMNNLNRLRVDLWKGVVRLLSEQAPFQKKLAPKSLSQKLLTETQSYMLSNYGK